MNILNIIKKIKHQFFCDYGPWVDSYTGLLQTKRCKTCNKIITRIAV